MAFTTNPLFRATAKRLQDAARQEFRRSDVGQLVNEAERIGRGAHSQQRLAQLVDRYARRHGSQLTSRLQSGEIGQLMGEVKKYSSGHFGKDVVTRLLSELGPAGKLISTLFKSSSSGGSSLERELDAAQSFLEAFGAKVDRPKGKRNARIRTVKGINEKAAAARELLESLGYEVSPPVDLVEQSKEDRRKQDQGRRSPKEPSLGTGTPQERKWSLPFGIDPETKAGTPRKVVDLEVQGRTRRFPVDHPIVTRKLIKTPESSNVYGFAYSIEQEWLYVWFKAPSVGGARTRPNSPGTMYKYSPVPPEKFLAMMDAPSRGTWIWDNLRIRGTVSGHRYDYSLVGITGGYLPRKATYTPRGEAYVPRTMRTHGAKGRTVKSSKSFQYVNRGTPNRGTPNRGRPDNGSPRK